MGKPPGLGLPADSHYHQQTQAAADSPKVQAEFLCAAQLSHSRVMPHRGAKTSSIKHLLANTIVQLWEAARLSRGQIQQSRSGETAAQESRNKKISGKDRGETGLKGMKGNFLFIEIYTVFF